MLTLIESFHKNLGKKAEFSNTGFSREKESDDRGKERRGGTVTIAITITDTITDHNYNHNHSYNHNYNYNSQQGV